jgi:hypothetical protein
VIVLGAVTATLLMFAPVILVYLIVLPGLRKSDAWRNRP